MEGVELDGAVRGAMPMSLTWCHDRLKESLGDGYDLTMPNEALDSQVFNSRQFGFYYSLSSALTLWERSQILDCTDELYSYWLGACGHYSQIWQEVYMFPVGGDLNSGMAITHLSQQHYTNQELICLNQWFDMEPDLSIELSDLTAEEFDRSRLALLKALTFIKNHLPDFYAEMQAITREIILAKPSGQQKMTFGGVSSFALWGALCLNIETHVNWYDFIASLIHEYSHNLLFAKAMNSPLVLNDPEARYFSPLRQTIRPMDGIYHAAFVSAREVIAAKEVLNMLGSDIEDDLRSHLEGTVIGSSQAFQDCLVTIKSDGQLSDLGKIILKNTVAAMGDCDVTYRKES